MPVAIKSGTNLDIFCMRCVITSRCELGRVAENFSSEILDYVTGLNLEGVSYVPEIGYTISKETVSENLEWNNQYLIMICRYMQQEEQE